MDNYKISKSWLTIKKIIIKKIECETFRFIEEMNECDTQENAAIPLIIHLQNAKCC